MAVSLNSPAQIAAKSAPTVPRKSDTLRAPLRFDRGDERRLSGGDRVDSELLGEGLEFAELQGAEVSPEFPGGSELRAYQAPSLFLFLLLGLGLLPALRRHRGRDDRVGNNGSFDHRFRFDRGDKRRLRGGIKAPLRRQAIEFVSGVDLHPAHDKMPFGDRFKARQNGVVLLFGHGSLVADAGREAKRVLLGKDLDTALALRLAPRVTREALSVDRFDGVGRSEACQEQPGDADREEVGFPAGRTPQVQRHPCSS
ncbi:hypothetical protein U1Q18_052057 [Sarracenia purpurea var. burkii]